MHDISCSKELPPNKIKTFFINHLIKFMILIIKLSLFLNLIPKRHIKNKIIIFDNIIKAEVIRLS